MTNGTKDDDIRDVMAEETRRGKRPFRAEAGSCKESDWKQYE
jgi:hypothetical protein